LKTAPDGAGWAVKTAPAAGARGRPSKLGKLVKKKDARQRPSKHGKLIKKKRALAAGKACGKQAGWWEAQLARLAAYKAAHGDCDVPKRWAKDGHRGGRSFGAKGFPGLGAWVGKQRKGKKKLDRGEPKCCGMTAERAAKLDALGFAWELSAAKLSQISRDRGKQAGWWDAKLARLAAYKALHGDCSVPMCWAEDPWLGNWVHNQRQLKRKLDRGEPSEGMTAERAAKLTAVGLVWDPGRGRRS
jgi:hypothetical protein